MIFDRDHDEKSEDGSDRSTDPKCTGRFRFFCKFSVKPWYDHGNAYNEQDRAEDPYDRFVI